MSGTAIDAIRRICERAGRSAVYRGVDASWFGYRWVPRENLIDHCWPAGAPARRCQIVHPRAVAGNPLPCNIASRDELPDDRGWWGYSFRDVPQRESHPTIIATIPDARIVCYRDPAKANDFYPAVLARGGRAVEYREVRFRPRHAEVLRAAHPAQRIERATWIIERVYHNHSHWLTAHLPKILLLRERGELQDVLLPPDRTPAIDGSLRGLGLDPQSFPTFDPTRPLDVGELTIVATDRFRPELLRLVPQAYGVLDAPRPGRRIFISRSKAVRRRLVNEDEVWSLLEPAGFERVWMEELDFAAQVDLMKQTAVLLAPHGAGLTNMMFCPPGAHIVELADLSFPNPNFYALASAMQHQYWVLPAEALGDEHPLEKDLRADLESLRRALDRICGTASHAGAPEARAR